MNRLSTGDSSTLGSYLILCKIVFGSDSPQVKFIQKKIDESPRGEQEEVLADERQMLQALGSMK